ncbi:MAG: DUF3578 domain-containing protein [Coriobacteriia bacterium]|nr:DUF3578 domain-containing protein [Coriobacteriia bacterium]
MLRNAILAVTSKYVAAKQQPFTGHPMASYLRHELPDALGAITPRRERYRYLGSPGKGRWADCPWVAVLDPIVTSSPKRGFYIVYLFSHDMKLVYLSIHQGVTDLVDAYGTSVASQVLRSQAAVSAAFLQSVEPVYVLAGAIDLRVAHRNWRSEQYEQGSIAAIKYEVDWLPDERSLVADYRSFLRLYDRLILEGPIAYSGPLSLNSADLSRSGADYSMRRLHWAADRNLSAITRARGDTRCSLCSVDLRYVYGQAGVEIIEAHCALDLDQQAKYMDPASIELASVPVCPTCHKYLHSAEDPTDLAGAAGRVASLYF